MDDCMCFSTCLDSSVGWIVGHPNRGWFEFQIKTIYVIK